MTLRRVAQHRPVLTYWLLATVFAALMLPLGLVLVRRYPNAVRDIAELSGGDLKTNILYSFPIAARVHGGLPLALFFLAQPATPLLAAYLTAWLIGRDRVRDLISRYRFWAPEIGWRHGLRTWFWAIGTLVGIKLLTGGLTAQTSQPGTWPDFHWTADPLSLTFWFLLVTSLFFDGGGLMEETGWRGFASPELLKRWSPLRAAIVVGVLWSFWHIPVKLDLLLAGLVPFLQFYVPFTLFTVLTTAWAGAR
jgi:membrane protease YdiL (CAAX protease family)